MVAMLSFDQENKLPKLLEDPEFEAFSQQRRAYGLNIFEAAGMHRQEIRHSNFLAVLLNPQESHGLGDAFLKRLLHKVIDNSSEPPPVSALTIALADFSDVLVSREWRNIDLLVVSKNNKLVLVIENKIESTGSEHQLHKYEQIVKSRFRNDQILFAYLTIDREDPSDKVWSVIDYSDVAGALQEARSRQLSNISNEAKMLVDHYIALIRRRIVTDPELIEQCRKLYKKHKQALELIFEHGREDPFDAAVAQFFDSHEELTKTSRAAFLPSSLYAVTPEMDGINWWGQSRPILFWFNFIRPDNKLALILEVGPFSGDKFDRETLVKQLLEHFKSNKRISPEFTRSTVTTKS
jgi:PD-(D/E)XK nuclease superfamily